MFFKRCGVIGSPKTNHEIMMPKTILASTRCIAIIAFAKQTLAIQYSFTLFNYMNVGFLINVGYETLLLKNRLIISVQLIWYDTLFLRWIVIEQNIRRYRLI